MTTQAQDWTAVKTHIRQLTSQYRSVGLSLAVQFQLVPVIPGTTYTYVGTRTMLKREAMNTAIGLSQNYAFSLVCDASQFKLAPVPKQRVIVAGTTYKIAEITQDALGACVTLHLTEEYARNG